MTVQGDVWSNQGTADFSIVRTGTDVYQVTYGTYSKSYQADNLKVDLDGSVLGGNILIDLGTTAPAALPQAITVDHGEDAGNSMDPGGAGVFVTNLVSGTSVTLGGTGLKIDGNLYATGRTDLPVAGDSLHLAGPSTVEGDFVASGVASVTTDATTLVAGYLVDSVNVAVDIHGVPVPNGPTYQEPGGFNFQALGQVADFVTVQGGASTGTGLSTVVLAGTIGSDVTIHVTGGTAFVDSTATVFRASFNFTAEANVSEALILGGSIGADANINLGGSATTASAVALVGTVSGSVNITGQSGFVLIVTALPTGPGTWEAATVDGNLTVDLGGNGVDVLVLNDGQGTKILGGVSFTGGSGFDREIVT